MGSAMRVSRATLLKKAMRRRKLPSAQCDLDIRATNLMSLKG